MYVWNYSLQASPAVTFTLFCLFIAYQRMDVRWYVCVKVRVLLRGARVLRLPSNERVVQYWRWCRTVQCKLHGRLRD